MSRKWNLLTAKEYAIKSNIKCPKCGNYGWIETAIILVTVDDRGREVHPISCPHCVDKDFDMPIEIGERVISDVSRGEWFDKLKESIE
jgi:hypothetical protein